MEIKVRAREDVVILDVYGTIDVNAAGLVEIVGQCLRDGYFDILCNFEEISSIDYMGISVLVIAYKDVMNHNGRMRFTAIPVHLKNLFSVSGLDRVIEVYSDEDLALKSFKEDRIIENIKRMQLRRRFKRLPIDIKIELKRKYERAPTCIKADIINLSAIGACIFGCSGFKLGDDLVLKFSLPPSNEEMELEAKVVWLPDKQVQPHLFPGMGIEFRAISVSQQEKIIGFVERNASLLTNEDAQE